MNRVLNWNNVRTTTQAQELITQVTKEIHALKSSTALQDIRGEQLLIAGHPRTATNGEMLELTMDKQGSIFHQSSTPVPQMDDSKEWVDSGPVLVTEENLPSIIERYRINPGDIKKLQEEIEAR